MGTLSLRDTAFALDAIRPHAWSLKDSLKATPWPPTPDKAPPAPLPGPFPPLATPLSVKRLAQHFGAAGAALRGFEAGSANVWSTLLRTTVIREVRERLRDPFVMAQRMTGLCGPLSVLMELARRNPARYVAFARELLETGEFTCPNGRVITAEAELREEPVPSGKDSLGNTVSVAQVDWMLAGTMRDDENIEEDVDDDANGLETITLWFAQRAWVRDMMGFSNADYETCFWGWEVDCMKLAQQAVKSGGVAFLLIDANMLHDGGSDSEEDMHWRHANHLAGYASQTDELHSMDDCPPPDHWVAYLGGLALGSDPGDDDAVNFRVWSWGREYTLRGTVDAFTEYLYAVVVAH